MAPKSRGFKDFKPKSKSKAANPQSENDFLEAADELEQAGGKWRAGDAAKAARFFQRAVKMYDEGLNKFPHSFDLAYNKAHLEYQLCEDDRIVAHLGSKIALLQETLTSHRAAQLLNHENSDIQFNTGQVLSSLAEALLETDSQATAKVSARSLLEEAAELFTHCLAVQQGQYEQKVIELANLPNESDLLRDTDAEVEQKSEDASSMASSGEWATVEEALTPEVILETCTAQLGVLATLIGLYDPGDLINFEQRVKDGLYTVNTSVPTLISLMNNAPSSQPEEQDESSGPTLSIPSPNAKEKPTTAPKDDALLAAAIFHVAVAEASYRYGHITAPQYATTVSTLFSPLVQDSQSPNQQLTNVNTKSAHADALIELASTIAEASPAAPTDLETQWSALSQAQNLLTQLCTPPGSIHLSASRLADIFAARGDIDLMRFNLSFLDEVRPTWRSSRNVLVSNSGVFYRGAKSYAEKEGKEGLAKIAGAKAVVAEVLKQVTENSNSMTVAKPGWKEQRAEVKRVLEQMVNEKILGQREGEKVLSIVSG